MTEPRRISIHWTIGLPETHGLYATRAAALYAIDVFESGRASELYSLIRTRSVITLQDLDREIPLPHPDEPEQDIHAALMDPEFLRAFAAAFARTPLPSRIDSLEGMISAQ